MPTTEVGVTIRAPLEMVFDTIAHIENFAKASPAIVGVEFLSETRRGVGTRFLETRRVGGGEGSSELEVTEYEPHERVRIVSDAGGTVWDSLFVVRESGGKTELTLTMEARPYKLLARLTSPLLKGTIRKAIVSDMEAVKSYCENLSKPEWTTREPEGTA